ncbi:6717_t:CDS:2 [Entrophospora sp. SA101]|nr:6717_t:CDS:2 [Entrophospora sp. SA101]
MIWQKCDVLICKLQTLANIKLNTADTGNAVIRQAVGEAQRKAQREKLTGEVEIEIKYNYSREAEVIHGNAATGEQYSLKRVVYSEVPITPEIAKHIGGNQIIKFTPTTELIFPSRVPIFDEKGNQIVEHVEIHHTDDGKTVRIKFRAAPKRANPNENRSFYETVGEKVGGFFSEKKEPESKRFRGQVEEGNRDSELTGNIEKVNSKMDIDKPETSTSKGQALDSGEFKPESLSENPSTENSFELLTDDEIEKANKNDLIDLIERIKKELEIRKKIEANSDGSFQTNYNLSTQQLKNKLERSESALNSFQTSSPNADKKTDDKNNAGIVVGTIAVVSALAIGSIALVKSKFGSKSSCNHSCPTCGKNTLTSIQPNAGDTGYSLIKQMVGEAQRKARRTGERGDIEVSRTVVNSNGRYYCQILTYNTQTEKPTEKEKPTVIQLDENQYKHFLIAAGNIIRELNSIAFKVKELEGAINKLESELRLIRIEMKEKK